PNWPPVCTYEGMDDLLSERYMTMAADNEAIVSPVGELWRVIRTNHPEIDLYDTDGSHPSAVGSYAAAVAFFTTIFRADPTTITFDFNLSADITTIIKEEAKVLIFEQQAQWFIGTYDDPNGPCAVVSVPNEHSVQTEQVFGFVSNDQLIISNTEKIVALEVYDVTGKLVIQRTNDFTNITLPSGSGVYLLHFTTTHGEARIQKVVR
ncbi:MAG: T9SS type A sorting domain-containing protein, partial [Flavobacteriales bacterium]